MSAEKSLTGLAAGPYEDGPDEGDDPCSCAMTEGSAEHCPVHGKDAPPL